LNEGIFAYVKIKVREIGKYYPDIEFKEINCDVDHIHMLVSVPPKYAISKIIQIFKSNTSRGIKQKFPFLQDVYWGTDGIWSEGYFVDTVGVNAEIIKNYIEHQGQQDSGQSLIEFG
jgi:putative transposase